jgi:hypothetical protein
MKNEDAQGETSSRSMLATSIIHDQPVSQLIKELNNNKKKRQDNKKPKKLSRKKPKLSEGVTYDDVFQWYNLSELQEFARDNSLKVSGKKKELIQRILNFLSNGTPAAPAASRKRSPPSSASSKKSGTSASGKAAERAKASPVFSKSTPDTLVNVHQLNLDLRHHQCRDSSLAGAHPSALHDRQQTTHRCSDRPVRGRAQEDGSLSIPLPNGSYHRYRG